MDLYAGQALLAGGWANNVRLRLDTNGHIADVAIDSSSEGARLLPGPLLPGLANVHSHAFQRVMAGLAETMRDAQDSFWSWREQMYGLVGRLEPEDVEAIATYLYVEMLKAGYTSVGEFHYLHHDRHGRPYDQPTEMADRVLSGADRAGIACTLLPALYSYGGFGPQPAKEHQRRFIHNCDKYAALWETLNKQLARHPLHSAGQCFHSVRAVALEQIKEILDLNTGEPVHIHIAEQSQEVEACIEWSGRRPVEWLLDHVPVDKRWCLVHATHVNATELDRLVRSGAIVCLCPTTEANLGDGIFPAATYINSGGAFSVGSDSHVSVSGVEELRWLEYGQRLLSHARNRIAVPDTPSVGRSLYDGAVAGGAKALGQPTGRIEPGVRADFVVLDGDHPLLAADTGDAILNRWIFAGDVSLVRDVYVAGRRVVHDGTHPDEKEVGLAFASVLRSLL